MKKTSERKYIKIRGANEHNLKNIDVDIPRDEFVVLTDCRDRENRPSRLIQSMPKDSGAIWSRCLPMQGQFLADGKAECGEYRGAVSGNLDRSEINESQSTFHSWNCYGDL